MVELMGQLPLVQDQRTGNQIAILGITYLGGVCTAVYDEWLEQCAAVHQHCPVWTSCSACQAPTSCFYYVNTTPGCKPNGGPPGSVLNFVQVCGALP
jgi:hypothetical protein